MKRILSTGAATASSATGHSDYAARLFDRLAALARPLSALGVAAALLWSPLSQAAVSRGAALGTQFQVNSQTIGDQTAPVVAVAGDGTFVVAYESPYIQNDPTTAVFAQRYRADGQILGAPISVSFNTPGGRPAVAMDAAGNFVVAYQVSGADGSGFGIYARRFPVTGETLDTFRVNTTVAGTQTSPAVAMSADGHAVIAWTSADQDGDGGGIYAQRYDATGTADGGEFRVNTTTVGSQGDPSATMNSSGAFVIAWNSPDSDSAGVYAQRFAASGAPQGDEMRLNTTTVANQFAPAVGMDAQGNFVAAWTNDGQNGNGSRVYARRFAASGTPLGEEFQLDDTTPNPQTSPAVAMDAPGEFIVSWRTGSFSRGVIFKRYDATGTPVGDREFVDGSTANDQGFPSVSMDPDGAAVIVWQGLGSGQNNQTTDIFGRRYGSLASVDLGTALTESADPVATGGSVSYSLFVTNTRTPDSAVANTGRSTGITATFDLNGLSYDEAFGSSWICTGQGPVTCRYDGTTPAGKTAPAVTLNARVIPGVASASVNARLVGDEFDANPANDLVTESTTVSTGGGTTAMPGSLQFAAASYSAAEAGGALSVSVNRIGGSDGAVSVRLSSSDGEALAGSDYGAADATLTWADGDAAPKSFSLPVLDDALAESSETFALALSNVTGGATLGAPAVSTVTILDDDAPPAAARGSLRFSATSFSAAEGAQAELIVFRTGGSSGVASVDYSTTGGNATAGRDYTSVSGTLSWADGDASPKRIVVATLPDTEVEPDKVVNVTLGNAQGAALGEVAAATLTIINDDFASTAPIVVKDSGGGAFGAPGLLVMSGLLWLRRRRVS